MLAFQIGAGITGLVKQDELVEIAHNIGMDTIDYWQDPEVQWAWTEMQVSYTESSFKYIVNASGRFKLLWN